MSATALVSVKAEPVKADPAAIAAGSTLAPHLQLLGTRRPSTGGKGALAPSSFYCPISMELMGDPCMVATGHTYERVSGAARLASAGTASSAHLQIPYSSRCFVPCSLGLQFVHLLLIWCS